MGKQINFYLLPKDYDTIQKYIQENGLQIFATPLLSQTINPSDRLLKDEENEKKSFYKRLLLLKNHHYFPKKLKDDLFILHVSFEKIIEFNACKWDKNNNSLGRGRIFYETGFYDEQGLWKEKDQEFLKTAEQLFRWFRKNFQKSELSYGFYCSPSVLEFVKNGGILKQF